MEQFEFIAAPFKTKITRRIAYKVPEEKEAFYLAIGGMSVHQYIADM